MNSFPSIQVRAKMCPWGRITIAPKSGIPELWSVFEISIKSPYPQVDFFRAVPFGPLLFMSQNDDQPSIYRAVFSGCVVRQWNNEQQTQLVPELCHTAWHLGIWSVYSEQLCKFGKTFQSEDPLTPAKGHILV